MVDVEFNYQQNMIIIQGNLNDSFETIIKKYIIKSNLDINNLYFISNGKIINKNDKLENIMSESNKMNKKIPILVNSLNNIINNENTNIKKSKDIICPICKEVCKYEIRDYKIKLYDCKNYHISENIKINEFENKQNIDISEIKCDKCKDKNKSNTFNNEFYICYECKMNLCPLCKLIHDKTHLIINYDNKNYICNKHNETLIQYCNDCKIDMCLSCSKEHKNHKIILYQNKLIDEKNLRNKLNQPGNETKKFKLNIEEIINKFKKVMENFDSIYNINDNILKNYEKNKNRNYKLLLNLNYMDKYIDNETQNIKDKFDYGKNLNQLLDVYKKMENIKEGIIYKSNRIQNEKLRIFGNKFVENNRGKCKIIYNNKEYELTEYINDIDERYYDNDEIKIKLKGISNVTNMSYMFYECDSLYLLNDISEWNTSKVTDMSYMFSNCIILSSLPDISVWDTSKVTDMNNMFNKCQALSSLPDISKWNISNVTNISYMFCECRALSSLPDISKWDITNITDMNHMFYCCNESLNIPYEFRRKRKKKHQVNYF